MDGKSYHVRVFLPSKCLEQNYGVLVGTREVSTSSTSFNVTNIYPEFDELETLAMLLQNLSYGRSTFEIIGFIQTQKGQEMRNSEEKNNEMLQTNYSHWIMMETIEGNLPRCYVRGSQINSSEDLLMIVYDCCEIMNSVFIARKQAGISDTNETDDCMTTLDMIVQNTERFEESVARNGQRNHCAHGDSSFHQRMISVEKFTIKIFKGLWSSFSLCKQYSGCNRFLGVMPIGKLTPATTQQLNARAQHMKKAVDDISSNSVSSLNRQRSRDYLSLHVLDVFFGIVIMTLLLQKGRPEIIANMVLSWAEHVVTYLQQLLRWMNGAPAGLKLNRQLNELLGKFFMYHIYLWTGYLGILRPVLVTLVQLVAVTGVLGISVQLAITSDLITMLTLHIYCFYVYAAKLYSLQIYTLTSLWRLFRGKKWNVIRQRVDSASFDVDQLFIGTLLFTALLFLLPTVGLYYVVFTTLRLLVLGIQGVLQKLIEIINLIPVASLARWILFPKTMSDRCKFSAIPRTSDAPQYLMMQMQPASVTKIMKLLCDSNKTIEDRGTSSLLKKICTGEILYPWMELRKS